MPPPHAAVETRAADNRFEPRAPGRGPKPAPAQATPTAMAGAFAKLQGLRKP